ncbi:SPARC-related modular calcium-binding protein 1, partial [Nephila pilipes]
QLPLRSDKPSTQCDIECTSEVGVPVCGNDGRTYESRCEIEKAKCQGHPVEFKHRGKCIVRRFTPTDPNIIFQGVRVDGFFGHHPLNSSKLISPDKNQKPPSQPMRIHPFFIEVG